MTYWEEQIAHQPTRDYYLTFKKIIKGKVGSALEIGTGWGITSRALIEEAGITHVTSVDQAADGWVEKANIMMKELDHEGRWEFVHSPADKFFADNKSNFALIFIDGSHCYDQVYKDINNAWKILDSGGLLICHDYLHEQNFLPTTDYGVTMACNQFMNEHRIGGVIYPPHPGILVITKP
jgi:predicted O-methyltransferase YrrM